MTLVTIDAVVHVPRNSGMREVCRVVPAMAPSALEDGIVGGIRVARRAYALCVPVSDRELRILRVVERCTGPSRSVVAILARIGEELRLRGVARVRRVLIVGLVATVASRRQRRVIAVHVAIRALTRRNDVRPCQRERRVVVVESRIRPHHRAMAQFTLLREASSGVGRIVCAVVVLQVARHASVSRNVVIAVGRVVAVRASARWNGVRSRQSETRAGVIESRGRP